jgi:DNA-binding response OmpR family regulator
MERALIKDMDVLGKILLVDDDMGIREVLSEVLSGEGFEVKVAKDGLESLDELERDNFDLVIIDINMPRLDGISMLRVMERAGRKEKVIIMSGSTVDRNTMNRDLPDIVDRINKPFKINKFLDVVTAAMANQ